jgi:predicted nucleotidyltransferase
MRVNKQHTDFIKQTISKFLPDATVYLFGSRVHDDQKGGDIDILVIGEKELTGQDKRGIKIAFYKKFGEQKIDIISFKKDDPSTFKELALLEAEKI